jgi:nucleoid-associated protein YgaU
MALGTGIAYGAGVAALIVGFIAASSGSAKASTNTGSGGSGGGPPPPSTKKYTVRAGDSMSVIAQRCTGNGNRFGELIAVNPSKPVGYQYHDIAANTWPIYSTQIYPDPSVMTLVGKVFMTLTPGEVINVPASWSCP